MRSANETRTPVSQVPDDDSDRMTEQSVIAVVGPASSDSAISTAHIFSAVGLAQISYSATSRILSDRSEYTSFFRTIPSDTYQVKAMVDIMEYFNWTYISLFGSDNSYGQLGMSSLEYEASKRNIDIALKKTFSYKDIRQIVTHLTGYIKNNPIVNRSNVLVIFAESHHAYALIKVSIVCVG
ncbi:unnamed protein product [Acanthosepion pharaonis]|uniref:Receptor ligand binding region domain-containing protein n=1 Tax=Acanthosepion pharaonis TaxID=158019 RepID=A0A812AX83_ACAPH|nr:unnamed protein product [Sepia pharaonis]